MTNNNSVDTSGQGQSNESTPDWRETLKNLGSGKSAPELAGGTPDGGEGRSGNAEDNRQDGGDTTLFRGASNQDRGQDRGQEQRGGDEGGDGDEGASAPSLILNKETLAEMFKQAVAAGQPAPAPRQLTEEELRTALNIFQATDGHLRSLGLEATPERVEALNTILQNVAKQATSVATFELNAALEAVTARIAPLAQFVEQSNLNNMKSRFFAQNKDLEGLEPLVVVAHQNLKSRGAKFNGEAEAFKAVAEETRQLLSKLPGFSNGKGQKQQQQQQRTPARKMPSLSSGGQGGAGDGRGQPSGPKWRQVLS